MLITTRLKHYAHYIEKDKMFEADLASEELRFMVRSMRGSYSVKLIVA